MINIYTLYLQIYVWHRVLVLVQILTLTSPMIGNYGVPNSKQKNDRDLSNTAMESSRIQVAALIVQDYSHQYSHWNANQSLSQWLKDSVEKLSLSLYLF